MDLLKFLNDVDNCTGNATLNVCFSDGSSTSVTHLRLDIIEQHCPLLAMAFEDSRSGPRYFIEDVSRKAFASLLRYAYGQPYNPLDDGRNFTLKSTE